MPGFLGNLSMNAILLTLLAVAVWSDLRQRRIPNQLILAGLVVGVLGQAFLDGSTGFAMAIAGAFTGLVCLLPLYANGAMGAGDVKLMAVCGAFVGPLMVIVAAVASLVIGGIIGLYCYFSFGHEPGDRGSVATHAPAERLESDRASPVVIPAGIPYALAIGAGAICSLIAADTVATLIFGGSVQ